MQSFFMEQHFKETAKQDNPHLLWIGAFKIYCERKQTAISSLFLRSSVLRFNYFFLAHSLYLVLS